MGEHVITGTDANFESVVVSSTIPVLVDFWAPWCGPCRMVGPIMEEIAEEYKGKATVVKINVDDNPNVSAKMGIRSIPTVVCFMNGTVQETVIGAQSKGAFTAMIAKALEA